MFPGVRKGVVGIQALPKLKEFGDKAVVAVAIALLDVVGNTWSICGCEYPTLDTDNHTEFLDVEEVIPNGIEGNFGLKTSVNFNMAQRSWTYHPGGAGLVRSYARRWVCLSPATPRVCGF